nr:cysteine protease ATG4 [Candidatus Bandiella numerosa]
MKYKLSTGILGGKSKNAMYYIGYYDDKIITLDPHTEQDAVTEIDDETIDSFITKYPKMIDFDDSDTSLAF